MNDEVARIADQLERAFDGAAWHGTPLRALLNDVDATTAARRVVTGAHTIWELTDHVSFWMDVVRRRLGEVPYDPPDSSDWRTVEFATPGRWQETLDALDRSHAELVAATRRLATENLAQMVPGQEYTNYVMLHGAVQHNLYHAGQIALLIRAAQTARE